MKTENDQKIDTAEVGVIIGRFQVPDLHEAHKEVIQHVIDKHPRVLIFLGLAADACKCTYTNPLDFPTRKAMIESSFPNVEIHYIKDQKEDALWSKELDRQIHQFTGPGQKCVLYGGRDSFIPHYNGKFPTVELVPSRIIAGKEIRKNVGIKSKNDPKFREGVIWAVENQWPQALPCVDIAIVDFDHDRLLLGRKAGEAKLRFIGGFASPNSDSYEEDAKREVSEETHVETADYRYVCSKKIPDWRFRSERNQIKTIFYVAKYVFGAPQADDDIAELEWVDLNKIQEDDMVEGHRVLLTELKKWLKNNRTIDECNLIVDVVKNY
jgi:bifunctional NMN adenylyltransferase/nudix hydrolase